MSTPPGGTWEPEPVDPAGSGPSDAAAASPSPYAAPGTAASAAPGYAALYGAEPYAGAATPVAPGYAALYPATSYPPPASYPGAPPAYPAPGYAYPSATPFQQRQPVGPMPPNHLVLAIVALLFVTLCGVVALVYATQVEGRWRSGDVAGAYAASESARKWGWASIIISGALLGLYLLLLVAAAVLGA